MSLPQEQDEEAGTKRQRLRSQSDQEEEEAELPIFSKESQTPRKDSLRALSENEASPQASDPPVAASADSPLPNLPKALMPKALQCGFYRAGAAEVVRDDAVVVAETDAVVLRTTESPGQEEDAALESESPPKPKRRLPERSQRLVTVPLSIIAEQQLDDSPSFSSRPRRIRMRPLEFWRNERVVYERLPGSHTPSISGVILHERSPSPPPREKPKQRQSRGSAKPEPEPKVEKPKTDDQPAKTLSRSKPKAQAKRAGRKSKTEPEAAKPDQDDTDETWRAASAASPPRRGRKKSVKRTLVDNLDSSILPIASKQDRVVRKKPAAAPSSISEPVHKKRRAGGIEAETEAEAGMFGMIDMDDERPVATSGRVDDISVDAATSSHISARSARSSQGAPTKRPVTAGESDTEASESEDDEASSGALPSRIQSAPATTRPAGNYEPASKKRRVSEGIDDSPKFGQQLSLKERLAAKKASALPVALPKSVRAGPSQRGPVPSVQASESRSVKTSAKVLDNGSFKTTGKVGAGRGEKSKTFIPPAPVSMAGPASSIRPAVLASPCRARRIVQETVPKASRERPAQQWSEPSPPRQEKLRKAGVKNATGARGKAKAQARPASTVTSGFHSKGPAPVARPASTVHSGPHRGAGGRSAQVGVQRVGTASMPAPTRQPAPVSRPAPMSILGMLEMHRLHGR